MKNINKSKQKSLFESVLDEDFIKELNDIGKQSIEDFKVVQSELEKDIESGLLSQLDVDHITNDFILNLKKQVASQSDETIAFTFENNRIQLFDHVPAIIKNIPVIAKRYLESKMLLSNVSIDRIHIGRISPEDIDGIEIVSVFYITPYGSRLMVDLKEIYNVLQKIDFD
jgi:hypothetical protein